MIRLSPLCVPLLAGLVASCASLSEEACRVGDWQGIGYRDGAAGRDSSYVANHAEACGKIGIAPDLAAWKEGRVAGLRQYCTPRNAYKVGQRGSALNPVCQGYDLGQLERANAQGRRYHEVDMEMSRVQFEIDQNNAEIDNLLEGKVTSADKRRIRGLRRDIERGQSMLRRLESEQRLYAYFP